MQCASITFEGTVAKRKCQITVDVTAEYDQPIAADLMREILVQVAIKITNPNELNSLARELSPQGVAPKPAESAPAPSQLAPPLLRTKLKLLKK